MHRHFCPFLSVLSILGAFAAAARADQAPKRPNIVLLLTDDQRADCLSCVGHPLLKTPNIDKLAAKGVLFKNAFVTTAICCVSRASIVTGKYARHHQVPDFQTPLPHTELSQSFITLLRQLGYRLAGFGKWGIGGPGPADPFDAWDASGGEGPYFHQEGEEKGHNTEWLG